MAALISCVGAITLAFGERIGVNGGQGWDGMAYTLWGRDFWHSVIDEGLTRYHSQRILPSAIVYYALRVFGVGLSNPNVIKAFMILNILALVVSAVLWAHLAHVLKLRRATVWVGFVALLASHANLRHALYYPTLTDPTAFAFGMAVVWAYLTDRPVALWLVTLAGVFTWPALPPLGLALLVFPRPRQQVSHEQRFRAVRLGLSILVSGVLALIFVLVARRYLLHPVPNVGDEKFAAWVLREWLVITIPFLVAMLVLGWFLLLRDRTLWHFDMYVRQLQWRRTIVAAGAAIVLIVVRSWWLSKIGHRGEGPTGAQFLCEHSLAAIRGPLWGPVHHVVYFGPIILVAFAAWPKIARTANAWGPSAVLALAMAVAFAAGSNSRQWNHLVPFVVVACLVATNERWTGRRAAIFVVLTLAWSKAWFKLGYDQPLNWHEFPNQRYFMNHGPYASNTMYLVHVIAAVITLGCLIVLLRKPSERQPAPG